jgi:hypothetical protein
MSIGVPNRKWYSVKQIEFSCVYSTWITKCPPPHHKSDRTEIGLWPWFTQGRTECTQDVPRGITLTLKLETSWNEMVHAQKSDLVFRAKRTSPFKSARWAGRQFSRLLRSRGLRISGSNTGYTVFRGSVKGTGYPLHSPVSPSIPLPCFTVCHHISTGIYQQI